MSPGDQAALEQREQPLRRGAVLLREYDALADRYVVERGVLMSYVLLHDGKRQILRFLFPGDLLALRTGGSPSATRPRCAANPFERLIDACLSWSPVAR